MQGDKLTALADKLWAKTTLRSLCRCFRMKAAIVRRTHIPGVDLRQSVIYCASLPETVVTGSKNGTGFLGQFDPLLSGVSFAAAPARCPPLLHALRAACTAAPSSTIVRYFW